MILKCQAFTGNSEKQIVIVVCIERCRACIQVRVLWRIFFTINKYKLFRTTQGMSPCNCTSIIVIISIDTVYDMSFMIRKCEMHIWTHWCLACLFDIRSAFIIHPQRHIFHNTLSLLNLSHSDNKTFAKVANQREGWGKLSCAVLKFRMAVNQNPYIAVKRSA